ncbi:MAG: hypothetical protein FJ088_14080 [Deltaproteobacteria bacterium]|nr:hypothetical protein [Deltaproteobacteria bacterium]
MEVSTLIEVVSAIRNIRGETGFAPNERVNVVIKPLAGGVAESAGDFSQEITRLGKCDVRIDGNAARPPFSAVGVGKGFEVYVEIGMERTLKERQRIGKNIEKTLKDLDFLNKKLSNAQFLENAPEEVVEKEREKKTELEERLAKLKHAFDSMED